MRGGRRVATLRVALALAVCAIGAVACGGPEPTTVVATFDDVIDLTVNAVVKIADVDVGYVEDIALSDDNRARVTLQVSPDLDLPSVVAARLRKTSVLGERYVQLLPDRDSGGSFPDGGEITDTGLLPDLEEVVLTSTDLLIAISTDTLAGAIEAGSAGLDGRGATLGGVIDDLDAIVSTYNANSDDLVALIDGLDGFLDSVGPNAALHGRSLEEAADFVRVLAEEDDRLVDALVDLQDLAVTGEDVIVTHRERFDDFVVRLERLTGELVEEQSFIADLNAVATHNFNTIRGVNAEHAQVLLDIIVCGINDDPTSPVRACEDPPQGQPRPEPRPPQDF